MNIYREIVVIIWDPNDKVTVSINNNSKLPIIHDTFVTALKK